MSGFSYSVDRNQATIIKECASFGISCRSVAGARKAGFDIVASRGGTNLLVEVKQVGERNNLRDSERWMLENWSGPFIVAETSDEILRWFELHG